MKKFIPAKLEDQLRDYKYSGSDKSPLYKHFFSPIAQYLVDNVLPETLAPNTVTLIGFSCTLVPHLIILYLFPFTLSGAIPPWLLYVTAIGHLCYMILDNADGKQARKTGNSSPLGLLFDHGCDAMNTFVSGLCVFTALQLGNTIWALVGYLIAFGVFFMATWEEYFVGSLDLPAFNGANEGVVGMVILFVFTGIVGTDFWTQSISGFQYNHLAVLGFALMAIPTVLMNLKNVKSKEGVNFGKAIKYLFTFLYLIATMFITYYLSKGLGIQSACRYFIYFIGFSFAKLVGLLQAAHCANVEFPQFRLSILLSCTLLNFNTIHGYFTDNILMPEDKLIYGLCIWSIVAHMYFIYCIINQFTRVLGIRVFTVKDKKKGFEAGLVSDPSTDISSDHTQESPLNA